MLLSDMRNFMKTHVECPQWYLNKMGSQKEQSITIYNLPQKNQIAIGGSLCTSYSIKNVSILIHWGRISDDAERKAQEIAELFSYCRNEAVNDFEILMCKVNGPIYVGLDSEGIIEYVVEAAIHYRR